MSDFYASIVITALLVFLAITVSSYYSQPVEKTRDALAINHAETLLKDLDKTIEEVASEGKNSTRRFPLEFGKGEIALSGGKIYFEINTTSEIFSVGTRTSDDLIYITEKTHGKYITKIELEYTDKAISGNFKINPGRYNLLITNGGYGHENKQVIGIRKI